MCEKYLHKRERSWSHNFFRRNHSIYIVEIISYFVKDDVSSPNKSSNRLSMEMFIEAAVWQGLASVIIPGFTINRICWMSAIALRNRTFLSSIQQKYLVTLIGLGSIPVIIKPIDRLVCFWIALKDHSPSELNVTRFINMWRYSLEKHVCNYS